MSLSGKVIILLNILTYRIDAFISNIADFLSILASSILIFDYLGLVNFTFEKILSSLLLTSVSVHFSYFIVYVINDFIDFKYVLKFNEPKYTFYKYRPVIFYKKRRIVVLAVTIWYIACITFTSTFFKAPLLVLPFALLFTALSFIRSIVRGMTKFLFFSLLRFHKYLYLIILLEMLLFNTVHNDITGIVILWLVVPYVTYDTIRYIRFSHQSKRVFSLRRDLIVSMICLILIILLSTFFIFPAYTAWKVIKPVTLGYMLMIIPHISATFLPGLIHRNEKPSFQRYLLDLLISLIITSLLCIGIIYYIIMH